MIHTIFSFKKRKLHTVVCILTVMHVLTSFTVFSQHGFSNTIIKEEKKINYEVYGNYKRSIKKSNIRDAKLISDVISGYPEKWITSYESVEMLVTYQGKMVKAVSANEKLSTEQKNLLNNIDLTTNLVINVKYNYKDPIKKEIEHNTMHVEMTVIPEVEAEYGTGYKEMIKYLKENSIQRLPAKKPNELTGAVIKFTINEGGEVINAKISQKWGDPKTDQLLLELINSMPKWKPAENIDGIKVKQDFVFSVGKGGC